MRGGGKEETGKEGKDERREGRSVEGKGRKEEEDLKVGKAQI